MSDTAYVITPTLPGGIRLLCAGLLQPSWVSLTLKLDAEGCQEPRFRWASTEVETLAILRDESFDCILVADDAVSGADRSTAFDAFSLIESLRAAGYHDPVVLISSWLPDDAWSFAVEQGCEVLISAQGWESPALVTIVKRALERIELASENHRLSVSNHRRLVREREEAEHLLQQQRHILVELEGLSRTVSKAAFDAPAEDGGEGDDPVLSRAGRNRLPEQFGAHYHELLRTYVIMGSGSLCADIAHSAATLAQAGLTPRAALELHLESVEALVRGLGNRSARHVMARADLMALELMVHLGECYQNQSLQRQREQSA